MEDHGDHYLPPFWQPPPTLTHRHRHRHRRPSPFLNSSLIIILLPSLLLLFTVFIVVPSVSKILPHNNNININTNKPEPSLSTAAPPIQKSISVKKGWDLLNIILVVFAILCGIFAKRNDDVPTPPERHNPTQQPSTQYNSNNNNIGVLLQRSQSVMTQPQSSWFDDHYSHQSQQQPSNASFSTPEVTPGISRLRRTVSSDPYTKFTGNSQFQFFDDLDIGKFYPKDEPQSHQVKDIPVDNDVILKTTSEESPSPTISPPQTPPRNPPAPPPPPPPPPPVKQRRTFQTVPRRERPTPAPAQSSSPPPAPPPPPRGREEKRRNARKRTTKDIATAIVSLYNHGKRKRRTKSSRNQEHRFPPPEIQSQSIPPPSPPPPPPPPPPVFHNWFKKGSKTKKVNSQSSTPTPTQPPAAPKPPLPKRRARESVPLKNVIPPAPPPPPPFKVAEMRFAVVGGGYVNVKVHNSAESWRSGSPERMTCPSPDVNLKADTFIARHHDGWKLEKLNSWREKVNKGGDGATLERWGPK